MKINRRLILMFVALALIALVTMGNTDGCTQMSEEQRNQFQRKIESTDQLLRNQPATMLGFSMDRYLADQRNVRFNDPNKMCYLYINTFDGAWLRMTIIGKVASTSKRLSAPEQEYLVNGSGANPLGPAPDEMGMYGSSDPAKIGISTMGSLLEFGGFLGYFVSEVPLSFEGLNRPMVNVTIEMPADQRAGFLDKLAALRQEASK